jgi:hypothetical protein
MQADEYKTNNTTVVNFYNNNPSLNFDKNLFINNII